MITDFFLPIPEKLRPLLGDQDGNTRMFKAAGTQEEMCVWFDAICEVGIQVLSPGGIAAYAGVTRAGVYRRIKAGLLTAFCFSITRKKKTLFGGEKKVREFPVVYIPVDEARVWKEELLNRWERIQAKKQVSEEDVKFVEESCLPYSPKGEDGSFFEKPPKKAKPRKT